MNNHGKELYEFGPFQLDPAKRVLLRDNQPVSLQLKAFETLLMLVRNSQQVVLKDDLMKAVWPDTFVEESNLAQNIFVLRKTLGETVGDHRYIVTIPGRGYRFAEKVRVISEEETLIVASHSRSRVVIEESRPRRVPALSVAGVLLLLRSGCDYRLPLLSTAPTRATCVGFAAHSHQTAAVGGCAGVPEPVRPQRPCLAFNRLLRDADH